MIVMSEFLKNAFKDMKENASAQHKIDHQNYEAVKADIKERFEAAKEPDPDFKEFMEADGLKEKAKVLVSHMERDGKKIAAENLEKHKEMLKSQREKINETIEGNW